MIEKLLPVLVIVTALGSGLMAGLFLAFSIAVMTGLDRLPAAHGIAAMQFINTSILNPVFGFVFGGTAVASLALAIIAPFRWGDDGSAWMLTGSLLSLAGGLLITIVFNVPRNDALAASIPTPRHRPASGRAMSRRGRRGTTFGPFSPWPRRCA